jgi:hypothetical protein
MTITRELSPQIRAVLERHAPAVTPYDLGRYSESIAWHYVIACVGRLAGSRRGTAPALKNLAAAHRKIISAAEAIQRLGPDEIAALKLERRNTSRYAGESLQAERAHRISVPKAVERAGTNHM